MRVCQILPLIHLNVATLNSTTKLKLATLTTSELDTQPNLLLFRNQITRVTNNHFNCTPAGGGVGHKGLS